MQDAIIPVYMIEIKSNNEFGALRTAWYHSQTYETMTDNILEVVCNIYTPDAGYERFEHSG